MLVLAQTRTEFTGTESYGSGCRTFMLIYHSHSIVIALSAIDLNAGVVLIFSRVIIYLSKQNVLVSHLH